jgi:hypothetical protein
MTRNRNRLALVPVLALLGCLPPHLDLGPLGEARTAGELLRRVDAAEGAVERVSGEARLVISGPGGRGSVALFVAVGRSASLHLEQLDFFGRPRMVLASDGRRFTLHDAETGRWYAGVPTRPALARFLPVALSAEALSALLLGRAPRLPASSAELALDAARARYRLTLTQGGRVQQLEVDPASARVLASSLDGDEVRFSGLEAMGGAVFPRSVRLERPAGRASLELTWTEVTLDPPEDASLFTLQPPEGTAVEELDEQGERKVDARP